MSLPPLFLAALLVLSIPNVLASEHAAHSEAAPRVLALLQQLQGDNGVYMATRKIEFFAGLAKGQSPLATVVTCADSRVQTAMFDRNPEGQLFMVRNIGNQLVTAEGSVEYGVHHLHTPLLLFVGHSRCGAVAAAGGNYSKESPAIRKELDTLALPKEIGNLEGVRLNVHNQVAAALVKFSDEVRARELVVAGAIMDFADDLHQGAGKLHLINLNGETRPERLQNLATLLKKPSAASAHDTQAAGGSAAQPAAAVHH